MCGIVGYVGGQEAEPLLLDGLRRLEYRGYDSAGLVTLSDEDARRIITDIAQKSGCKRAVK